MTFDFNNDKQRQAAKIILKRCAGDTAPNQVQLSKLVNRKSSYETVKSAIGFVKDFISDPSTPIKVEEEKVIRTDIKKKVVD